MKKLLLFLFLSLGLTSISYGETQNTYYENGQLKLEENYINDKLEGKSTGWCDNGQLSHEGNYINGIREGKVTGWE